MLGGLAAGALATTAAAQSSTAPVTADSFYTNDSYIPGVGWYHAPFGDFFPFPYNHYDPARRQYFFGGQWAPAPHRSVVNISSPSPEVARRAQALRTDVRRGGFGGTSGSHFIRS